MFYHLYEFVHSSMGMHFWDLIAFAEAAILAAVLVVHTRNQKKRSGQFDRAREEHLDELRNGSSGKAAKA